ncbi:hypothetical protein BGZ83_008176 [Gryganskiella cystojenkinii]|nr:hypothetical protein BGZ83_008176 [Gryganskiella cystojenkinii]
MKFTWIVSTVALAIALFLTPTHSATDFGFDPFTPAKFQNIMRSQGCNNGLYHLKCKPGSIDSVGFKGCEYFWIKVDLPANTEYCIYHDSGLDVTTCFIFSNTVQAQDFMYFIYRIFYDDIFNFYEGGGLGIASKAWVQGWIWNDDKSYGTYYGVYLQMSPWKTLGAQLPDTSSFKWPENMLLRTRSDRNC